MDKIEKELRKLDRNEKTWLKEALSKLRKGELDGLNVKKLKVIENIFRIRKGDIRIIYRMENSRIFILAIERRREDTYKI